MCDDQCIVTWKSNLSFYITGVINISIAILGLTMNLFGLYVIKRIKNKHLFHKLITCLTVIDSCVLSLSIVDGVYRGLKVRNKLLTYTYPYITHPCFYICVCGSILMTICISHERYFALQDPVRYSNGSHRLRKNQFFKYGLATVLFSITYNISRFLDLSFVCFTKLSDYKAFVLEDDIMLARPQDLPKTTEKCNKGNFTMRTVVRKTYVFDGYNETFRSMKLQENEGVFRMITSLADCIVMGLVPFCLLIFFNAWIYMFVKKQRKIVSRTSGTTTISQQIDNRIRTHEIRMAISFISIVMVFVTCYSIWLVYATITAIHYWKYRECLNPKETHAICDVTSKLGYISMEYIGHLLITINSSVNILLYGSNWNQFQEEAKELIIQIYPCIKSKKTEMPNSKRLFYLQTTSNNTDESSVPLSTFTTSRK